jgi:branched-chain amino acid transport system substrate-binding protein
MQDSNRHTEDRSDASGLGTVDRRKFLTVAGAGATAALAGCSGGGGGGGGNGDGGGGGGGGDPIRIGGIYLLSGLAEQLGAGSAAAAEVAVDAINEEGGINGRNVEIEVRDHGDDPQAQMRSLVQEFGADVMIGLTSSGVTLNSGPTIEQLGVPFTLTDIGTPYITEPDTDTYGDFYDGNGRAAGLPNLFRTNSMTAIMTYGIAQYTADNFDGGLRIANMGPDYAYGQQCWAYYQAYLDGLGVDYEVVASEFPSLGAGDMTPQITTVQSADPDIVFTSFWAGDTVTFTSQAAEQGLFEEVDDVFDTIGADPVNFNSLGDTMPDGVHYSGWYWPGTYDTDADQSFIDLYQETYQDDDEVLAYPTFTGGSTWAAVQIYKDAIEAAGSTNPDDIISQMEGYTFENDPRGTITLDETSHQANASCVIGESSQDADVPYDGAGQINRQTYTLGRSEAQDLLEGSEGLLGGSNDLPPGI